MIVTGWHNGSPDIKTGEAFGIRIRPEDRDQYFNRRWEVVKLEMDTVKVFRVRLSRGFWGNCTELRSKWLGKWMLEKRLAPWPKSSPPKMRLEPSGDELFMLSS